MIKPFFILTGHHIATGRTELLSAAASRQKLIEKRKRFSEGGDYVHLRCVRLEDNNPSTISDHMSNRVEYRQYR